MWLTGRTKTILYLRRPETFKAWGIKSFWTILILSLAEKTQKPLFHRAVLLAGNFTLKTMDVATNDVAKRIR